MTATRLDQLRRRQAQLAAQIAGLDARARHQARKRDTRRKIVLGGFVAKHMAMNPGSPVTAALMDILDRFVTSPADRQLLNLPPIARLPAGSSAGKSRPSLRDGTPILKRRPSHGDATGRAPCQIERRSRLKAGAGAGRVNNAHNLLPSIKPREGALPGREVV